MHDSHVQEAQAQTGRCTVVLLAHDPAGPGFRPVDGTEPQRIVVTPYLTAPQKSRIFVIPIGAEAVALTDEVRPR